MHSDGAGNLKEIDAPQKNIAECGHERETVVVTAGRFVLIIISRRTL
jgi:hypothetical protein